MYSGSVSLRKLRSSLVVSKPGRAEKSFVRGPVVSNSVEPPHRDGPEAAPRRASELVRSALTHGPNVGRLIFENVDRFDYPPLFFAP